MSADITLQYLERVLKFKARKELHEGFIGKKERQKFLKELTLELDFDELIWLERKKASKDHFLAYQMISKDTLLSHKSPAVYSHQLLTELIQAINLDPFNSNYLKEYCTNYGHDWKPEKKYKQRYLQLTNPATTEFTNLQVELGLGPNDYDLDYFNSDVTGPYVDALIFIQQKTITEQNYISKKDLQSIAKEAGIEKKLFKELDGELEKMLKAVQETNNNHWLNWKDMHKALLIVDRLTDLAPYNPDVLYVVIHFYGHSLWRVCLDSIDINKNVEERKAFFKAYLNKEKPKYQEKIDAAKASFEKAKALEQQFLGLPQELFEKKEEDPFDLIRKFRSKMNSHGLDITPAYVQAFMRAEESMLAIYMAEKEFRKNNNKFSLLIGIVLYALSALLCVFVLGSIHFLWTFFIVPGMAAAGLGQLRLEWWKKKRV